MVITEPDNGPPLCACGCGDRVQWINPRRYRPRYLPKHHLAALHKACSGQGNGSWKGGESRVGDYIYVYDPTHAHANYRGYVKRSHLVIAEKVGRWPLKTEHVHHINRNTHDDRPENLELLTHADHAHRHTAERIGGWLANVCSNPNNLSADTVRSIRAALATSPSIAAVARQFNKPHSVVGRIANGQSYRRII